MKPLVLAHCACPADWSRHSPPCSPMRTSLELVPRSAAELDITARLIATRYPRIETVNIPDRPNCDLGSVDAAAHLHGRIAHRIPHLRACDFDAAKAERLIDSLSTNAITEVIVVAGDHDGVRGGFEPSALIEFLATRSRTLVVYAAFDPHRYRDDAALARNIERKRAAGAAGFFTQPLFDV